MGMSVWSASISQNQIYKLHQIFYACCLLGPLLTTCKMLCTFGFVVVDDVICLLIMARYRRPERACVQSDSPEGSTG